jgi:hypothetical protein
MQKVLESYTDIQGPLDELMTLIPATLLEMSCCFNDLEGLTKLTTGTTKRRYLSLLIANFQTFVIGVYDAKAPDNYTVMFDVGNLEETKNEFNTKIWYILKHLIDGYVDFLNGLVRDLTINKLSPQELTKKYKRPACKLPDKHKCCDQTAVPTDCVYLFGAQKLTKCQLLLSQLSVSMKKYVANYKPLDINLEKRLPGYKSHDLMVKQQLEGFSNYMNDCDMYFSGKLGEVNYAIGLIKSY